MLACINPNSVEYQSLKDRAGIPESILKPICRTFLAQYNRMPYLDELPDSNSEPYLKSQLKVKANDSAKIKQIYSFTNTNNIEDAVIKINKEFRDLETNIIPLEKEAIVEIVHRPTDNNFNTIPVEQDEEVNDQLIFSTAISKLASSYGIQFNTITDSELNTEKWRGLIPDASAVNAFIYKGQIYINTDRASVDAPLHEISHMLIGSLRFTNPELYQELVSSVENFPNYDLLAENYPGRTRNDVNEEIFVTEMAKLLTGRETSIENLDDNIRYEIMYNVKRLLDSVLMGQDSVKVVPDEDLPFITLKDLAKTVNSVALVNKNKGTLDVSQSEIHRQVNNYKAQLLRRGIITEFCE